MSVSMERLSNLDVAAMFSYLATKAIIDWLARPKDSTPLPSLRSNYHVQNRIPMSLIKTTERSGIVT